MILKDEYRRLLRKLADLEREQMQLQQRAMGELDRSEKVVTFQNDLSFEISREIQQVLTRLNEIDKAVSEAAS